ncbi:MAG TPA: hypothetical protein VFA70_06060 [Dehalococcoidia bacterium]|nr:hypothetical protein [Dehalococcoidia bacterium]
MWGFKRRAAPQAQQCAHAGALPRWDRVEDDGNPDRVSRWYCPACDKFVTKPDVATAENTHVG